MGGLGVPDLRNLNLCLLSSWIFRYHLDSSPIWRQIVDYKYKTEKPNLLCCPDSNASPFWRGVLWAIRAAKMGIRWTVGNGHKIRFWEDIWFGNSSLATQFWPLYIINEQHGKTIAEVWDGETLKLSFRRAVSENLMQMWFELLEIVEEVVLLEDEDQIIWSYSSNGKYSVQSLYVVINHKGITPVYVHNVWKLQIPPRVQMFLWLLSKNRTLTRDNLAKRRELAYLTCLFCTERETVDHLFFHCSVAKRLWHIVLNILNLPVVCSYEILASRWLANQRHTVNNIICAAVIWCLWKFRNDMCFQGRLWISEKQVLVWTAKILRRWLPMFKMEVGVQVEAVILQLEHQAGQPLELGWEGTRSSQTAGSDLLTTQALELDFTDATSSEPIIGLNSESVFFNPEFVQDCNELGR